MKRGAQRRNVRSEKRERNRRGDARHKADLAKRRQSEVKLVAWGCWSASGESFEEWFDVDLT